MATTEASNPSIVSFSNEELKEYLTSLSIGINERDFRILEDECITGESFLELTQEDFTKMGIKLGPTKILLKIISNHKKSMENTTCIYSNNENDKSGSLMCVDNKGLEIDSPQSSNGVLNLSTNLMIPDKVERIDDSSALKNLVKTRKQANIYKTFSRYKTLKETIKRNPEGENILISLEKNQHSVTNESLRKKVVKIIVDELVEVQGLKPKNIIKLNLAKAVTKEFPTFNNNIKKDKVVKCIGHKLFFDPKTRTGYIQNRLQVLHRARKEEKKDNEVEKKMIKTSNKREELLNRDEVEGEEEVLGSSFNIRHVVNGEVKWIPRNKLHKILAAHENLLRRKYYRLHGINEDYPTVENEILRWQQELSRKGPEGREDLRTFFDGYRLCHDDNNDLDNNTYPHFSIATLSRVVGCNVEHVKIVELPRYPPLAAKKKLGYSEYNIFKCVDDDYKLNNHLTNSEKVILDIHSTLQLHAFVCGYLIPNTHPPIHEFIRDLLNKRKNLYINMSYYCYYNAWQEPEIPRFRQCPIQLVREPEETYYDLIMNIFPSSGYVFTREIIKRAMKAFVPRGLGLYEEINRKFDIELPYRRRWRANVRGRGQRRGRRG